MTANVPDGGNYGQFTYQSSIAFIEPEANEETNICVDLSGYGSKAAALTPDTVYYLSGRLVGVANAPVVFFEQQLNLPIGKSENYMSALAGKVSVWGFGVVVARQEVRMPIPGVNSTQVNLKVTLQHSDYHNIVRGTVSLL